MPITAEISITFQCKSLLIWIEVAENSFVVVVVVVVVVLMMMMMMMMMCLTVQLQ
jgi:hypothetical protein